MSEVIFSIGEELHQPDGQVEQSSSLPVNHLLVLGLGWTNEVVSPMYFHSLASVQLQHLLGEHADSLGMTKLEDFLEANEHDIVGAVDGAWLPIDQMSTWLTSP